jgi:hypothetical protein
MTPLEAHTTIANAVADLFQGNTPNISLFTIPRIKAALAGEDRAATMAAVVRQLVAHPEVGPVLRDAVRKAAGR